MAEQSSSLVCCVCTQTKPSDEFTPNFPEPVCKDCEPYGDLSWVLRTHQVALDKAKRLRQRLVNKAERIRGILQPQYDVKVSQNAEFLRLLINHMDRWLKCFEADLLDSKTLLSKHCDSDRVTLDRGYVADGRLVLLQIMKETYAYKQQWDELLRNNQEPDDLNRPEFTKEMLVDIIKRCPVIQYGSLYDEREFASSKRAKRCYDDVWLLENVGNRFISFSDERKVSLKRRKVKLRYGPVSAVITREDLDPEPEQDLTGFFCIKLERTKQETSLIIFAALPHVMRVNYALQRAYSDVFAVLRMLPLSQLGWAYEYRHQLADRAWTRRIIKGGMGDDDRDILARISDFWTDRPDREDSLDKGKSLSGDGDTDKKSSVLDSGDAVRSTQWPRRHLENRYPDIWAKTKDLLGDYTEFFQLLVDAKAKGCLIGRTIFEPIIRLASRGKVQRQDNCTGVVVSDLISLLPGRPVTRFSLHDAIEAACRLSSEYCVVSPSAIDEFLTGNLRPIKSFFKGDIPDGQSQPPAFFFLLPPDEYPQELAVTALTTTYASTIIIGIKNRDIGKQSTFEATLTKIWKGLFPRKHEIARRFMYLELDGRSKPEVSSLLIRSALEISQLRNLPDYFELAAGNNDKDKRLRIKRWAQREGSSNNFRVRAAEAICRHCSSFGPLLLLGQADPRVRSEKSTSDDGESSKDSETSDEDDSLDSQEDGTALDFDAITTDFNNFDMSDAARVEELACLAFERNPAQRLQFTISSKDELEILHSRDSPDSRTRGQEHQDEADLDMKARISRYRRFFRQIISNIAKLSLISYTPKFRTASSLFVFKDFAWLRFMAANSSEEGINRLLALMTDFSFHNKAIQYILGGKTWPKAMFDMLPKVEISQPKTLSMNYGQYLGIAPMLSGDYWFYAGSATQKTPSIDTSTGMAARMLHGHQAILKNGQDWIKNARRKGYCGVLFIHEKMAASDRPFFVSMLEYPQQKTSRLDSLTRCLCLLSECVAMVYLDLCTATSNLTSNSSHIQRTAFLAPLLRPRGLPSLPGFGANRCLPILQTFKPGWSLSRSSDNRTEQLNTLLKEHWEKTGSNVLTDAQVESICKRMDWNIVARRKLVEKSYQSFLLARGQVYEYTKPSPLKESTYLWSAIVQSVEEAGTELVEKDGAYDLDFRSLNLSRVSQIATEAAPPEMKNYFTKSRCHSLLHDTSTHRSKMIHRLFLLPSNWVQLQQGNLKIDNMQNYLTVATSIRRRITDVTHRIIHKFLTDHQLVETRSDKSVWLTTKPAFESTELVTLAIQQLQVDTHIDQNVHVTTEAWSSIRLEYLIGEVISKALRTLLNPGLPRKEWKAWSRLTEVESGWISDYGQAQPEMSSSYSVSGPAVSMIKEVADLSAEELETLRRILAQSVRSTDETLSGELPQLPQPLPEKDKAVDNGFFRILDRDGQYHKSEIFKITSRPRIQKTSKTPPPGTADYLEGWEIIPTESEGLECGLFALVHSLEHQMPNLTTPTTSDLRDIVNGQLITGRALEAGVAHHTNNFAVDQLAAALMEWGDSIGTALQLGYITPTGPPVVVFPESGRSTLWIFNDEAEASGPDTINHYSGLKPRIVADSQPQLAMKRTHIRFGIHAKDFPSEQECPRSLSGSMLCMPEERAAMRKEQSVQEAMRTMSGNGMLM
ncbi:unnamed protein product [Clonostachys solani]|uniref:Uncharacterized protein n=1 Tax=Clonostachys solani TaxID=160281 RepID=A0A9N9Z606_9HYPO|nr:unnamed protein product [Clonostachys solani]